MLALGVAALCACAIELYRVSPWGAAISGVATALVIVGYDAFHKQNPLSPLVMGLCRVGVYVSAAVTATGQWQSVPWTAAAALVAYLIGLTYIAKQENLARLGSVWPLAFLAVPFGVALEALWSGVAAAYWVGLLAWVVFAISLLVRRPPQIPRAVVSFIAGIALVDALLVAAAGAPLWAVFGVAGFGATLLLQRFVAGT